MEKIKKTGIYKILSPNERIYIGQSIDIEKRWYIHKGLYSNDDTKLIRSFKKYGVNNHKFEIIEECSKEFLNIKEKYWVNFYNSIKEGLNIEEGGNGKSMSDKTKQKISKAKTNHECYKNSDRNRKISEKLIGREKTWKKGEEKQGKKQTKEFKSHLRQLHCKEIIQYDLENNFIKEWPSIKTAADELNIHRESIGNVLRNKTKTSGKYKWKYKKLIKNYDEK